MALADCFDVMTAERCYSKSMAPSAVVKEIHRNRGTQFDERLALQFIKTIGLYPPGTIVEMANGCLGIVLERSQKYQHLPKVLLLKDSKQQKARKQLLNLSLIEQGKLGREHLIKHDHANDYAGIRIADHQDFIVTFE